MSLENFIFMILGLIAFGFILHNTRILDEDELKEDYFEKHVNNRKSK